MKKKADFLSWIVFQRVRMQRAHLSNFCNYTPLRDDGGGNREGRQQHRIWRAPMAHNAVLTELPGLRRPPSLASFTTPTCCAGSTDIRQHAEGNCNQEEAVQYHIG